MVDVRDVANHHVQAMTHPDANGKRFISAEHKPTSMQNMASILKSIDIDVINLSNSELDQKYNSHIKEMVIDKNGTIINDVDLSDIAWVENKGNGSTNYVFKSDVDTYVNDFFPYLEVVKKPIDASAFISIWDWICNTRCSNSPCTSFNLRIRLVCATIISTIMGLLGQIPSCSQRWS